MSWLGIVAQSLLTLDFAAGYKIYVVVGKVLAVQRLIGREKLKLDWV